MVELTTDQSASADLYADELLKFAVKLLNGPADVIFMVGSDNVQGLGLVGEEAVCPIGDTRTRKGFNLQSLVISFAGGGPKQGDVLKFSKWIRVLKTQLVHRKQSVSAWGR